MRVLAAMAVIVIHQRIFFDEPGPVFSVLAILLNQLARFAVPFFFVVSGYFWARRIPADGRVWRYTGPQVARLAGLFSFWSLIYLLPVGEPATDWRSWASITAGVALRWSYQAQRPWYEWLLHGTWQHLWFLAALACCMLITAFFVKVRKPRALAVASAVLYGFGVLARAYEATPIGFHIDFDTLFGPFFGLAFFATGVYLATLVLTERLRRIALTLIIVGAALHLAEAFFLWRLFGVTPVAHSYVLGTYPLGVGMALLALSGPVWLSCRRLARFGRFTAGVYCIHLLILDGLRPYFVGEPPIARELGLFACVVIGSFAATALLQAHRRTRVLV